MKKVLDKIDKFLSFAENTVIMVGFSVMFILLLLQVVMRYIFNSPLTWSEETARFIFCYVSFIGISYAYYHGSHIRMELLINYLPAKVKKYLDTFIQLATAILFIYMIPFSTKYIRIQSRVKSTATHIPMSIVYIALPLGMTLASIRLIIKVIRTIALKEDCEATK